MVSARFRNHIRCAEKQLTTSQITTAKMVKVKNGGQLCANSLLILCRLKLYGVMYFGGGMIDSVDTGTKSGDLVKRRLS